MDYSKWHIALKVLTACCSLCLRHIMSGFFFLPYEITLHFFFLRKMQRGPDTLTSPVDIHIWFVFKLYTSSLSSRLLKTKPKEKKPFGFWFHFLMERMKLPSFLSIWSFSHYFKSHIMFKFVWYFISINVKKVVYFYMFQSSSLSLHFEYHCVSVVFVKEKVSVP